MKTGTSGSVSSMTSADSTSIQATQARTIKRHDAGEHDLRQIAREVRLERVDALHSRGGDLACLDPVHGRGLGAQPPLDERKPKLGQNRRGRAASCDLEPPREDASSREGQREQGDLGPDVAERGAVERAGDDPGEQGRLHEDEHRGREADRRVEAEQRSRRPRVPQESRVEGEHPLSAGRRVARLRSQRLDGGFRRLPAADPRPEDVVRPPLVEEDDRRRRSTQRRSSPRACSAATTRRRRSGCSRSRCSTPSRAGRGW